VPSTLSCNHSQQIYTCITTTDQINENVDLSSFCPRNVIGSNLNCHSNIQWILAALKYVCYKLVELT